MQTRSFLCPHMPRQPHSVGQTHIMRVPKNSLSCHIMRVPKNSEFSLGHRIWKIGLFYYSVRGTTKESSVIRCYRKFFGSMY